MTTILPMTTACSTSNIEFNVKSMIGTAIQQWVIWSTVAQHYSHSHLLLLLSFLDQFLTTLLCNAHRSDSRLFPFPFSSNLFAFVFLKFKSCCSCFNMKTEKKKKNQKMWCLTAWRGVAQRVHVPFVCLFVLSPFALAAHPLVVNYYEDIHNQFNWLFVYDSYSRTVQYVYGAGTWEPHLGRERACPLLFRLFAWKIIVCDWLIHLLDLIFWWRWCAWLRTATCVFRKRQKALLLLLLLIPIASSSHSSSGIQNVCSRSMMHT